MVWRADGADMTLVDVEVVDADGNRCPTALNLIKFDLQGPAEWRGGGIAVGTNNFILSKVLPGGMRHQPGDSSLASGGWENHFDGKF